MDRSQAFKKKPLPVDEPHKKKDRFYYRRTGALWTDFHHTPEHRLIYSGYRPDLDDSKCI